VSVVRYADDLVVGLEHEDDARRFLDALRERFGAFSLSLHPGKTRSIEFGRHAAAERKKRGIGRLETFAFLASSSSAANLDAEPSNYSGRPAATACGPSCRKSRQSCDKERTTYPVSGTLIEASRYRPLRLLCGAHK